MNQLEPKLLQVKRFSDARGVFTKPWEAAGINGDFIPSELYLSNSHAGSFRGLHFQEGASAQAKFLTVISGSIIDFCLDIREDSKNFGRLYSFELDANNAEGIFVPRGFAHGFYSQSDSSVLNLCDNPYDENAERGFRPTSFSEIASLENLILSQKDSTLPPFVGKP